MIGRSPKGCRIRASRQKLRRREVQEETGLAAEIIDKVGGINDEFVPHANDTRYDKSVSFYLTAAVDGNMASHDAGYGMVS